MCVKREAKNQNLNNCDRLRPNPLSATTKTKNKHKLCATLSAEFLPGKEVEDFEAKNFCVDLV